MNPPFKKRPLIHTFQPQESLAEGKNEFAIFIYRDETLFRIENPICDYFEGSKIKYESHYYTIQTIIHNPEALTTTYLIY